MSPHASGINLIFFVIEGVLDQLMKEEDGGVLTISGVGGASTRLNLLEIPIL